MTPHLWYLNGDTNNIYKSIEKQILFVFLIYTHEAVIDSIIVATIYVKLVSGHLGQVYEGLCLKAVL